MGSLGLRAGRVGHAHAQALLLAVGPPPLSVPADGQGFWAEKLCSSGQGAQTRPLLAWEPRACKL